MISGFLGTNVGEELVFHGTLIYVHFGRRLSVTGGLKGALAIPGHVLEFPGNPQDISYHGNNVISNARGRKRMIHTDSSVSVNIISHAESGGAHRKRSGYGYGKHGTCLVL